MKKFILHTVLFISFSAIIVFTIFSFPFSVYLTPASDSYKILKSVKNKINSKTILVGDSICNQFFGEFKSEGIFCLCYIQVYEVVGNFLLLKELLENKSNFQRFVLVINPLSLTASLNQKGTYNYFYKPFKNTLNNFNYLDESTQIYIQKNFQNPLYEPKYYFSSKTYFDMDASFIEKDVYKISDLNYTYLLEIKKLCEENNIEFKLVSPPLPEKKFKNIVARFSKDNLLEFSDYFNSILYYDDNLSKDGIHHNNPKELKLEISYKDYLQQFIE